MDIAIPLTLFLVWNAVILGSITSFETGFDNIADPLQQLRSTNGAVGPIVEVFSLLAIAPSYIGFVSSLVDFLSVGVFLLIFRKDGSMSHVIIMVVDLSVSNFDTKLVFNDLDGNNFPVVHRQALSRVSWTTSESIDLRSQILEVL
ncbi:uncharacterized protein LOC130771064 [Actinidia eriantha]|uniref:uncharacterized protein LOC130771064 n=1 Tax=Actinidia eriantha TaxID=165200 RepID=UPI00258B4B10|nr:uncharacterized protein LOC130771064 [Actinidia eriantha]